jgi:hypothetical protein
MAYMVLGVSIHDLSVTQRVVQTVTLNLYWHFGLSIAAHFDYWLLFTIDKHCSLCHKIAAHHIFGLPRPT